jgi:hypothetical protein
VSSKGRGAPVVDSEFYPTPAWCTRRILEALPVALCDPRLTWLEPCAGDGAIVSQLPVAHISAGDIRDVTPHGRVNDHWQVSSFSGWVTPKNVVITNPPFSLAPELIRHFLPRCDWLILLLRASFRLSEWRHNMPDEYKLPQRPEFLASEKCVGAGSPVVNGTRAKKGERGCGWARKVALDVPRSERCPACCGIVQRSTSDSSEYSWFVWTPERNRSAGLTRVLPDTPLEERKER